MPDLEGLFALVCFEVFEHLECNAEELTGYAHDAVLELGSLELADGVLCVDGHLDTPHWRAARRPARYRIRIAFRNVVAYDVYDGTATDELMLADVMYDDERQLWTLHSTTVGELEVHSSAPVALLDVAWRAYMRRTLFRWKQQ